MARKRGSYAFGKRQRELAKKQKKQEKIARRQGKKEPGSEDEPVPGSGSSVES